MINVSNNLKITCNSDKLQYKEYIIIDSIVVEIKSKMSNSCYNEGNIFGTFIMKKLEFTTENNIDYKGKEFVYYKSVNGESFKIGTYIVTEIKDNDSDETVTVTSLDYGLKTAIPYTTELDYTSGTVTLFDVLIEACTNAGLNLENGSITNGDFIVDSNQFTDNQLIGDVIKAIAHISGDFATINEDDKVELVYEEETDEIIEDYTELADKRDTQPITSVSIGTSQVSGQEAILRDEDMIAEYGEHWLVLNDNPFAYTLEKRQELVTAIFNKVKGFSYSSFESSYSFKPYSQLGDKIKYRNKAGELINSRVLKIDTDYDDIKLSAPSIIKATVDYKNSPNAYEVAKRAEVIANQATSSITLLASSIETTTEELTNATTLIAETEEGKKFHLEDSAEANNKTVELYGESTQSTRSGKNKTDYNNWTVISGGTINKSNDQIVFNTSSMCYGVWDTERTLKPNTTYTAFADYNFTGVMGGQWGFRTQINGTWGIASNSNIKKFTTDITGKVVLAFYLGTPYNTADKILTLNNIRMYEGEYTAETIPAYEQYGTSPSPDYPSAITSAGDSNNSISIMSIGKNLLENTLTPQTINGITFTKNSDGTVLVNGTATAAVSCYLTYGLHSKLVIGKTYTSSIGQAMTANIRMLVEEATSSGWKRTISNQSNPTWIWNGYISGGDRVRVCIVISSGTTVTNLLLKPMIEQASTETAYEPYKESKITIPYVLRSLPNGTRDRIYYSNGKWYDEQKIETITLNGNNISWTYQTPVVSTNYAYFYGQLTSATKIFGQNYVSNKLVCPTTTVGSSYVAITDTIGRGEDGNSNNIRLYILSSRLSSNTVSALNTWLTNALPEVQYELATPIITEITDTSTIEALENIRLYSGITNITSDAPMVLTYYRDTNFAKEYEPIGEANKKQRITTEKFAQQEITNDSIVNSVSTINTTIINDYATKSSVTSEISQNVEEININLKKVGGVNLIKNSTLKLGIDKNATTTGTVTVEQYTEIRNATISKSAIKVNTGSVLFDPCNVKEGQTYTFSCLVNKLALANASITITNVLDNTINIISEAEKFVEIESTFVALSAQVQIKLECDNNYCLFADCMLSIGDKKNWQLAQGEILTSSVTIADDEITISNTNSNTKWISDTNSTRIINAETGETRVLFAGDRTELNNLFVEGINQHGKVIETDFGTHVTTTWDTTN